MTLYSNPRGLQPRLWCCRGELRPKEASLALQLQRRDAEALSMIISQPPCAFLRGRFVTGFLTFKGILQDARKVPYWSRIGTKELHRRLRCSKYLPKSCLSSETPTPARLAPNGFYSTRNSTNMMRLPNKKVNVKILTPPMFIRKYTQLWILQQAI